MSETLSPNPPPPTAAAYRLQSPTSPFQLGSNDDQLERARVRAARAAAIRRKPVVPPQFVAPDPDPDPCFSKEQITELFQNCIKLSSENKINQKNTWDLTLIDHISEIIKVDAEEDVETNFQKASCTLEAGVKIYASRVDSVHSEAYKVLGGINRAGRGDEQEADLDGDHIGSEHEDGHSKKETVKKMSPLSTLESSFEALNVKKFDVAFAVDPLYHQTSAQFDEGGARALLLNNLGVYGCCCVVFDSFEVPGKNTPPDTQYDKLGTIDVSFAKEYIEEMLSNISRKHEISPTLRSIIDKFDEDNRRPSNMYSVSQEERQEDDVADHNNAEQVTDACENGGSWGPDQDDNSSVVDDNSNYPEPVFPDHQEEYDPDAFHEPAISENSENVADFLFLGLGFTSNRNAWAGPDHWKYRRVKGSEDSPVTENGSPVPPKKTKHKKQSEPDICFANCLDKEMPDIFVPAKNPKTLLLPANRLPCNNTLPEDCHYQPEDLVKLFLLPNTLCLGKRARKSSDESRANDLGPSPSWDDEDVYGNNFDDVNVHSDMEDDTFTLVSQRRQVNKIEVKYDKTSKQVDVHALKVTLWNHIQGSANLQELGHEEPVSFKHVLSTFPDDCQAASIEDISPHLCFICLLHLANEHGLRIRGCPNLDDLQIEIPTPT